MPNPSQSSGLERKAVQDVTSMLNDRFPPLPVTGQGR